MKNHSAILLMRRSATVLGRSNVKVQISPGTLGCLETVRACCARGRAHSAVVYFAALSVLLAVAVTSCAPNAALQQPAAMPGATGWNSVPAILSRILPPPFPARDFPITDFGAKPDGATDCTEAIAKAIAACHEAGGGRVVVADGAFLTGAVHLLSNVNLHIAAGATLQFSPDRAKFLPVVFTRFEGSECMNYSPLIYAFGQKNIAVTGAGTLDGSGAQTWWGLRAQGAGGVRQDDILTNAGDIATTHVTTDRAANNCGG